MNRLPYSWRTTFVGNVAASMFSRNKRAIGEARNVVEEYVKNHLFATRDPSICQLLIVSID